MIEALIIAIIAGLFGLSSHRQKKNNKKNEKRQKENDARVEKRAELRRQENMLSIRFASASLHLGIVTALAVQNKDMNGSLERALAEAKAAEEAYEIFLKEIAVQQITAD
jgi:hypothetical protein